MNVTAALLAAALLQAPAPVAVDQQLRVIARGQQSGVEHSRQVVATTRAEFNALWRAHATTAPPDLDFARRSVVGLFLGTRPSAGYSVRVLSVRTAADVTEVRYQEVRPPSDAVTAQVLTFPYILVEIPAVRGSVRFQLVP